MKTTISLSLAVLCLVTIGPAAKAVSPPPDSCYPSYTTAEGCNALQSLTTGLGNTGLGWYSLFSNSIGSYNTATGAGALTLNNADSNTAVGAAALLLNTTGRFNTATGAYALLSNTTADGNTANGVGALQLNTTGTGNAAMGFDALLHNTTGNGNTAHGYLALSSNIIGSGNTAVGTGALGNSTTGNSNTAVGNGALGNSTTQFENTALGINAGSNVTTASHVICIGAFVAGGNVDTSCFIGNIRGITTANNDAIPVYIDSAGQLGTASSSRRYKTEIKPIDKASESILALKPVSFRYTAHKDSTPQFGLIAEEVAEVNPGLVVYDPDGKPYTVRYDAVNAMLLNEFLKEHRKGEQQDRRIEELHATVTKQQEQIERLMATLKDQSSQIQKVSAQVELNKPAPQVIVSNQ